MAVALTTRDNPYSPFTEWKQWLSYDFSAGHNTNEKIARLANSVLDEEDEEAEAFLELQAFLFIIEHDPQNIYILVQDNGEEVQEE